MIEPALLVELGGEVHHAAGAVEADHLAQAKPEAVPIGLGEIVELVAGHVHAAGGDFVEQRLPQMGARLLDQGDVGAAGPAERIAEARDQLEPAGAAADHDDAMQVVARHDDAMDVVARHDDAMDVGARRGLHHRLIRRRACHGRSPLWAGQGIVNRVMQCWRCKGVSSSRTSRRTSNAAASFRKLPARPVALFVS